MEESLVYLRANREWLNLTAIARAIDLDAATMKRAVDGVTDALGRPVRIPRAKLPPLAAIIRQLQTSPGSAVRA